MLFPKDEVNHKTDETDEYRMAMAIWFAKMLVGL